MGRRVSYDRCVVGIVAIMVLFGGNVYAGDSNDKGPDDATIKEVLDCRYRQASELSEGKATNEVFPSDDLFVLWPIRNSRSSLPSGNPPVAR